MKYINKDGSPTEKAKAIAEDYLNKVPIEVISQTHGVKHQIIYYVIGLMNIPRRGSPKERKIPIGSKFGHLTVISDRFFEHKERSKQRRAYYKCLCVCGKEIDKKPQDIKDVEYLSCGCKNPEITHGDTRHGKIAKLYYIWGGMKNRCFKKNSRSYEWYGGKGISICEDWLDYRVFKQWAVENGYKDGLSIDRINSNDNYGPNNCRWVTRSENSTFSNDKKWAKWKKEDKETEELRKIVVSLQMELALNASLNKKVGFIAGCFDFLHKGHIFLLQELKKQCDILHVAINWDDYIRVTKKREPLRFWTERRMDLLATGIVDFVHGFYSNPIDLILQIKPAVIGVGNDYAEDKIIGAQEIKQWGGEVRIITRIPNISTTNIISKLNEQ